MIQITDDIFIREQDITFRASRSSGPGGQNINKLNTRVTLFFDAANCESLSDLQKRRILTRLATRTDKNGVLRVVSQRFRTQKANRNAAQERLVQLLGEALRPRPVRKKTGVPQRARRERLEDKRRRSVLKKMRSDKDFEF